MKKTTKDELDDENGEEDDEQPLPISKLSIMEVNKKLFAKYDRNLIIIISTTDNNQPLSKEV